MIAPPLNLDFLPNFPKTHCQSYRRFLTSARNDTEDCGIGGKEVAIR